MKNVNNASTIILSVIYIEYFDIMQQLCRSNRHKIKNITKEVS